MQSTEIVWTGNYGKSLQVIGELCIPCCLEIHEFENESKLILNNDKLSRSIATLNSILSSTTPRVHTISSPYSSNLLERFVIKQTFGHLATTDKDKLNCKFPNCFKTIKLTSMRLHVARHILMMQNGPTPQTCGFCGQKGCLISTEVNKSKTVKVLSSCQYFYPFSMKSAAKMSANCPTTNRPENCSVCNNIFWTYNMEIHYKLAHPTVSCPFLISDDERYAVLAV